MSKGEGRGGRDSGGEGGEEEEEEEKKEKEEKEEEGEEEEDSDDEGEDSDEEEEEVGIALQLPQRATRGLAYQRLIGEALEEDQAFWNHNTWADEEEDADYNCSEGEDVYADVIDSDFDHPEDDDEEDSTSDGGGGEGEGEGRHRGGEGGETSMTKQRDSRHRREKKRKKGRRGRDSDEEDEDAGEHKKTRKQGFELMWKKRQAKLEREDRQRRERKKAQAKGQLQKEEEGGRNRRPQARGEEDRRETHRGKREGGTSQGKQEDKAGGFSGVETRQLRVTRGRRFRTGEGSSSTSDEHENNGSKSSSSSRQKRQKRQQKKPLETRPRGRATAREVTLEEHLEEARRTEEKNLAVLLAMEERDEARRLRHVFDLKKNVYAGDYDRYFSWASWLVVGEEAAEDAEAFPAAETAAADTTQRQQMQQEVETKQEQQQGAQPQQWKTDVHTATVSRDSKVESAEWQKRWKGGREEEAARAAATQRDVRETGGAKEGPHALLHSVKEESAAMAGADGKCRRAAEEAAAAPAESAAAGREGIETSSTSGGTGEGQAPEKTWSRLSACGTPERKEKNEVTRSEKRSTASSGLSETGSRPLPPRRQQEEQQLPQQWLPEQHLLMQQGRQPHQQRQTNEGKLDQPYMRLEQRSTQQQWTEAVEATGEEKGARALGDEEDGEDGTQEEPRESEGYAMELRMFTDGKIPDMYTQQPIGAPTPHLRCIITGQRAKYRDPLTGAPYATLHAFKCLRKTFQHLREQRLLQVMQEIKDVLGTARSAGHHECSTTSAAIGAVFGFESPSAAAASPAPAGAGCNRHASVPSGLPLHSGIISGTSGSTGGYASVIGKDVEAATNNQMRQRKAGAGGGQALLAKKREFQSLIKKPVTSANLPQESDSCSETVASRTAPVSVEGWPVCREAEQKRRRNGRNAVSCGKKAACSRTTKKL